MSLGKGAAMNDKLRFEVFGWVFGATIIAAWISMPFWLGS
jgi:hypothetical protein